MGCGVVSVRRGAEYTFEVACRIDSMFIYCCGCGIYLNLCADLEDVVVIAMYRL